MRVGLLRYLRDGDLYALIAHLDLRPSDKLTSFVHNDNLAHRAVRDRQLGIFKWLLDNHPDLVFSKKNSLGQTPAHLGASTNQVDVLAIIHEYQLVNTSQKDLFMEMDVEGRTVAHYSAMPFDPEFNVERTDGSVEGEPEKAVDWLFQHMPWVFKSPINLDDWPIAKQYIQSKIELRLSSKSLYFTMFMHIIQHGINNNSSQILRAEIILEILNYLAGPLNVKLEGAISTFIKNPNKASKTDVSKSIKDISLALAQISVFSSREPAEIKPAEIETAEIEPAETEPAEYRTCCCGN